LKGIETEKVSEVPVEWALLKGTKSYLIGCDNKVLVEWIGMSRDLHPFAAAGDNRQHC
jgi:hypothetical protein